MPSLALDSRRVALDLHQVLAQLDPARWRSELEGPVRAQLRDIERALSALVERSWPEGQLDTLHARLAELRDVLYRNLPDDGGLEAWVEFRGRCQPAYEAVAAALRDAGTHVPSLRPTNYTRNAYHVANALGLILLVQVALVTPTLRIGVALLGAGAAWSMELGRRFDPRINALLMRAFARVAHPHEAHRINSATWFTTALLVLAVAFSLPSGLAALAVLGVGDPTAAIVGRRFGRVKLVNGRTLEGTTAFVVAGTAAAALVLAAFHPAPAGELLARAFVAALAGGLAELATRRIDDNLAIPVAAAAAGDLLLWLGG